MFPELRNANLCDGGRAMAPPSEKDDKESAERGLGPLEGTPLPGGPHVGWAWRTGRGSVA